MYLAEDVADYIINYENEKQNNSNTVKLNKK